ncbi:DUF4350 domain-containing protein [Microbacterium sp. BWT-B31]|uniref:DUF4350 domain-containing protein n=1 Tax=Microbacterium sp. BWT-B31 TaxID=3232072 RepID=UPI00352927DE
MTLTDASRAAAGAEEPRSRPRRRAVLGWVVIGLVVLVVGGFGAVLGGLGQWSQRGMLDPESAGPNGTRAIAEILRDHGVEVTVTRDRAAAAAALNEASATLVLPDAPALSDEGIERLTDAATDVVLIDPRARTLRLAFPGSEPAGSAGPDPLVPACDLAAASIAGVVAPGAVFTAGDALEACYRSGDGYGLLADHHGQDGWASAIDGRALLTNERLAENSNAALAANLMGRLPHLVWYVPSAADTDLAAHYPSLGELTPPWVSPAIVLLLVAGVAATVWRGRRFGPLVAERLAVTVRSSETTEGRARLYAQSRDAAHALDQLRIGALERIARLLGLGPAASVAEICDAAAARTGFERGLVRAILVDEVPAGDAQLVELAQNVRHIERAVQEAVRPPGSDPRTTPTDQGGS